jgi:hypothetical protein
MTRSNSAFLMLKSFCQISGVSEPAVSGHHDEYGMRKLTFLQRPAKQKDMVPIVLGYQDRMTFHKWSATQRSRVPFYEIKAARDIRSIPHLRSV